MVDWSLCGALVPPEVVWTLPWWKYDTDLVASSLWGLTRGRIQTLQLQLHQQSHQPPNALHALLWVYQILCGFHQTHHPSSVAHCRSGLSYSRYKPSPFTSWHIWKETFELYLYVNITRSTLLQSSLHLTEPLGSNSTCCWWVEATGTDYGHQRQKFPFQNVYILILILGKTLNKSCISVQSFFKNNCKILKNVPSWDTPIHKQGYPRSTHHVWIWCLRWARDGRSGPRGMPLTFKNKSNFWSFVQRGWGLLSNTHTQTQKH